MFVVHSVDITPNRVSGGSIYIYSEMSFDVITYLYIILVYYNFPSFHYRDENVNFTISPQRGCVLMF